MAKVQKGAKIDFYKFVAVKPPSSESQMSAGDKAVVTAVNSNIQATNNLGKTLNSLAKVVKDIKTIQLARLTAEQKKNLRFDPKYNTPQGRTGLSFMKSFRAGKIPGFLESLLGLLGGLFKLFVVVPALKWLGDPRNQKKVTTLVNTLVTIAKFIFDVAKFGVVNTIEGLYKLLSDESNWWERIGGLLQAAAGLGTLLLGIRWLSNPVKLVTDFGNVLKFFNARLKGAKARMLMRRGLKASVIVGGAYMISEGMRVGADDGTEEKSQGGALRSLPQAALGGWIHGPQSGYPVSLDGGRSTSFIGHGTEYVARKANGGAFVVPFNTPGTKTQPHLTQKRLGEAKRLGFSQGGTLPPNKELSPSAAFEHVYELAKKAGGAKFPEIVAAQAMHETGYLNPKLPSVYNSTGRTNAFGQTGDRGFGTIPRSGFTDGWTKYDNLFSATKDNIKLWHDVANHPQNYNAFDNPLDGIAAVAQAYSPNADPENIRLGYTTDGYSKGMVKALKIGGFDPKKGKTTQPMTSGTGGPNLLQRALGFFGLNTAHNEQGNDARPVERSNVTGSVVPASHSETGSGFGIAGQKDQSGRPLVFSKPAADAFAKALAASGMDLGKHVASSGRSKSKNDAIGGHPNSAHMYGEGLDINGPGYEWLKQNGPRYGWKYKYNHGPGSAHFQFVGPGSGTTPILNKHGITRSPSVSANSNSEDMVRNEGKVTLNDLFGLGKASPSTVMGTGEGGRKETSGYDPRMGASNFNAVQNRQDGNLLKQTQARNAARAEINDRTQMMVQSAIDAVTVANSSNQEKIKMAQQSVLSLIAQAKQQSSRPVLVGGGGGGSYGGGGGGGGGSFSSRVSTASKLGSAINAVGKIFG